MKVLLVILIFLSAMTYSVAGVSAPDTSAKKMSLLNSEVICFTYTYERVFKDGIWWIYVYDEDGHLVNIYPDR